MCPIVGRATEINNNVQDIICIIIRNEYAQSRDGLVKTNCTKSCPIQGIADSRLVITVAPQSDICPAYFIVSKYNGKG